MTKREQVQRGRQMRAIREGARIRLEQMADNRPETLREDLSRITYIFSGYDGRIFLRGFRELPWHQLFVDERRMQVLPWFLRTYPDNYERWQRRLYSVVVDGRREVKDVLRPAVSWYRRKRA